MGEIVTSNDDVLRQLGLASPTADEAEIVSSSILFAERAVRRYLHYDPVQRTRTEFYPQLDLNRGGRLGVWEASSTTAYLRDVSGNYSDELQLRHLPIRSIASIYVDYDGRFGKRSGSFSSETLKTEGTDYWARYDGQDDDSNLICRDGIVLTQGTWPSSPGSIKITYTAGYTANDFTGVSLRVNAVPIYEAVVFEAARKAKQVFLLSKNSGSSGSGSGSGTGWTAGTIQSEKLGDYSYTLSSSSGGSSSGGGAGSGGLYDGAVDLSSESMERLADYVNLGWSLVG